MTTQAGSNADNLEMQLSGETVPEKFRGKTMKDVLNSYGELETVVSRQGRELGELRKLTTSLVDVAVQAPQKTEPVKNPVTSDDLLADPDKTINDAIETHPAVKQARQTAEQLERQLAVANFEKKHPSFREDVQNSEFRSWVEGNPALSRLAAQADGYDLNAADALFTLWGERKSVKAEVERKQQEQETRRAKEKAGTLEGSSGADASSEQVYSRAELRELHRKALLGDKAAKAKWEDPKFRQARLAAYKDKRVS